MIPENIFFIILILIVVICLLCSCSALIQNMNSMCDCSSNCGCGCQNGGSCACQNSSADYIQQYKLGGKNGMRVNMSSGDPSKGMTIDQPDSSVVVSDGVHASVSQFNGHDYVVLPNSLAGYVE